MPHPLATVFIALGALTIPLSETAAPIIGGFGVLCQVLSMLADAGYAAQAREDDLS